MTRLSEAAFSDKVEYALTCGGLTAEEVRDRTYACRCLICNQPTEPDNYCPKCDRDSDPAPDGA